MDEDFDKMFDNDFDGPRICAAPETSANISSKTGRDEQANYVILGGVILVLLILVGEIARLIETVRSAFGL